MMLKIIACSMSSTLLMVMTGKETIINYSYNSTERYETGVWRVREILKMFQDLSSQPDLYSYANDVSTLTDI
jgi:hypothetical protein